MYILYLYVQCVCVCPHAFLSRAPREEHVLLAPGSGLAPPSPIGANRIGSLRSGRPRALHELGDHLQVVGPEVRGRDHLAPAWSAAWPRGPPGKAGRGGVKPGKRARKAMERLGTPGILGALWSGELGEGLGALWVGSRAIDVKAAENLKKRDSKP